MSGALAFSLFAGVGATDAWADVQKSDLIAGRSVEARGIPAAQCPSIEAAHALVIDQDGKVYFERDAATSTQIASITKIMTALVALDNAPLDTQVTVSERAAKVGESSANLLQGDTMTLDVALQALMIPSGNDSAIAIAEAVGGVLLGSTSDPAASYNTFVDKMNEKARAIGCADSVFENPHGLDNGEHRGNMHSSAADVAKIAAHAMANATFREIVSMGDTVITVQRAGVATPVELKSTDMLLKEFDGACGIKTGMTDLAGFCFAGAANRNGKDLYAIVLKSTSNTARFDDAETLLQWVYDNRVTYALAHAEQVASMTRDGQTTEVPVVAEVSHASWLDKTVKATFADPAASIEVFALDGNVSQSFEFAEITGSVRAGDKIGKATFYQNNAVVAEQDLIACEDVAAPNFFESIGIWWSRLTGGFSGKPDAAESVILNDTPLIYDKSSLSSSSKSGSANQQSNAMNQQATAANEQSS